MADGSSASPYVFTKEAINRSIAALVVNPIHEHFAGYLAILRARQSNGQLGIRPADITDFHDRYLRVVGAPDKAPYIRPFKSRGQGLETFNANVAGSYAPSSLRTGGKLIDVIVVSGGQRNTTYGLQVEHATAALDRLLKGQKVPIGALTSFLYRDYGFLLEEPKVEHVVRLFRKEFGLAEDIADQQRIFGILFSDDLSNFTEGDLEALNKGDAANG